MFTDNGSAVSKTIEGKEKSMTIHSNINIRAGALDREQQQAGAFGVVSISGQKKKNGTENQGMKFGGQIDPIEQKKALAKKRAYKIIKDALAGELKRDADVQVVKDHAEQLRCDMAQAQNEIARIDGEKEKWREECGVAEDSEEQKDLELLEKREAYERGDFSKELTKEEKEHLAELDKRGYTDYQKKALEMEKKKAPYTDTVQKAEAGIIADNAVVRATRLERLKKDFIREAQKEENEVLAAASKEIIGMLVDEAKDHMDEKSEELQEKAEEKKEEKEAEQEKIDAAKEKKEEMEALANPEKVSSEQTAATQVAPPSGDKMTEAMVQLDSNKGDYQKEIEEMMRKMKLVAEDIKGIKVDEIF